MNHPIEFISTLILLLCGLVFGSIVSSVGNVRQSFSGEGKPENLAIEAGKGEGGAATLAGRVECPAGDQISALPGQTIRGPKTGEPGRGKDREKCQISSVSPEEAARVIEERIDSIETKLELLLDRIEKIEPKAM